MSNDLRIKIDIIKDNQKTFQILEQPDICFPIYYDNETDVNIDSVNCPEFCDCPDYIATGFTLYLRGDDSTKDFDVLTFYFNETDMERLITALTKFCEEMEWNLKLVGTYFKEIVLGEL